MPRGQFKYGWPVSLVDPGLMNQLHLASLRTGLPITWAVREALVQYVARVQATSDPVEATIAAGRQM